ncbi:metallophosphoesterase family protein [Dethiobacter alkaliphilus]|uniref:Phosphoesterase n=1 Tax=Dethiobacter alkaliphilus AHT 1 TaxID=555088 RepID=C0GCV5_DETAL|nr:metallophosphoesterase [Dethiobacter alkaliphilus]EEG79040.1 phosphodiesterase, MJ0936 family [Dethiobacter alkaliphilus AHT 1]
MRIGVLSDTHIPARAKHLPPVLFDLFDGVDLILHAGDLVEESVLDDLTAIAPVEAVAGNMDSFEVHERLGEKKILQLAGYNIGLIHGNIGSNRSKTPQRSLEAFAGEAVDCVVFGHSHQPYNERVNGVLLFNPGSPTDRRREPRHSCGIITLGKTIEAEIIYL